MRQTCKERKRFKENKNIFIKTKLVAKILSSGFVTQQEGGSHKNVQAENLD